MPIQGQQNGDYNQQINNYNADRPDLIDIEIEQELDKICKGRFFRGFRGIDRSSRLAERIISSDLRGGSNKVKARALGWCAQLLSREVETTHPWEIYKHAKNLAEVQEVEIAGAVITFADGNLPNALDALSTLNTPASYTAAFQIKTNSAGIQGSLNWLNAVKLSFDKLNSDGKFIFIFHNLELNRWDEALECVMLLEDADYEHTPILLFTAAITHLVHTIPEEYRQDALDQVPFEVKAFRLASDSEALTARKKAIRLFDNFCNKASELGCTESANIASDFSLWLKLRGSYTKAKGMKILEGSLLDPEHSFRRLNFAFHFGMNLNASLIEDEIENRITVKGGISYDIALARLTLSLMQESPKAAAEYIARYRDEMSEYLDSTMLRIRQIELLAQAGITSQAESLLSELLEEGLSKSQEYLLQRMINESQGSDPAEARKLQFENSKEINDLINLVNYLDKQSRWTELCHYGKQLFDRTLSVEDAERLAIAYNELGRFSEISELLEKYPELCDQSTNLKGLWAWQLFRKGLLKDAENELTPILKCRNHPGDRLLYVKISIASGNWKELSSFIEDEWNNKNQREPIELLQTAQLASAIGSLRAKELLFAAVDKSARNPDILAQAYFIATRSGWDNDEETHLWLKIAMDESDETGPLQKASLKELVSERPAWQKRESHAWDLLHKGEIPVFGAAQMLNQTLADFFLYPSLRNPSKVDIRRRVAIPAFSGIQHLTENTGLSKVGIEATALFTLSSLDLLDTVIENYDHVVIPHETLGWLFDELNSVSYHQPSRIENARKLQHLIDSGALKEITFQTSTDRDLAAEIGDDLALLIAEAKVIVHKENDNPIQKLVVTPFPVHRSGSFLEEEVDLSRYSENICNCISIVEKLWKKGQLTAAEKEHSLSYLMLHDQPTKWKTDIPDGATLYLNDLATTYLRHLGLLEKLKPAGLVAYVTKTKRSKANELLEYESITNLEKDAIEKIRASLAIGINTGKVTINSQAKEIGGDTNILNMSHPTFSSIHLADTVNTVISDDRYLNQSPLFKSTAGQADLITSLHVLETLQNESLINHDQWLECRTNLRRSGYIFIPISIGEINTHLSNALVDSGVLIETAELKAIRENLLKAKMNKYLQLPKELQWLLGVTNVFIQSLHSQWSDTLNTDVSEARSNWLLSLIDLRGWANCMVENGSVFLSGFGHGINIVQLLMAPYKSSEKVKEVYLRWVDLKVIKRIKSNDKGLYTSLLERIKLLVSETIEKKPSISDKRTYSPLEESQQIMLALRLFPRSIRDSIYSDPSFVKKHSLQISPVIRIGTPNVYFQQSIVFDAMGDLYKGEFGSKTILDENKDPWKIYFKEIEGEKLVALNQNELDYHLPNYDFLCQDKDIRTTNHLKKVNEYFLPESESSSWNKVLTNRPLKNTEVFEYEAEFEQTPAWVSEKLHSDFKENSFDFSFLSDRDEKYFHRLIGRTNNSSSLSEYTDKEFRDHVSRLITWNEIEGFLSSLLLATHSSITSIIAEKSIGIGSNKLVQAYSWLVRNGDLISIIGGIEVGLSIVHEKPEIEQYLTTMIGIVSEDDTNHSYSRFHLLSSIVVEIENELSRTKVLAHWPPFQRRLAVFAQAGIIERIIPKDEESIKFFIKWVETNGGLRFYLQTICDLRIEPRWIPDFISPQQLKHEFIGRIFDGLTGNQDRLEDFSDLKKNLSNDNPGNIRSKLTFPYSFYPGPLDGNVDSSHNLPKEFRQEVDSKLNSSNLEPGSFAPLINLNPIFQTLPNHAQLAAEAIRSAKYHLNRIVDNDEILSVLRGLSNVAATTRSPELAEELRRLVRKYRNDPNPISVTHAADVCLVASAAHSNRTKWNSFLGEWLTELAFGDLDQEEASHLHSQIKWLCHIQPELWISCGRAEAALSSLNN